MALSSLGVLKIRLAVPLLGVTAALALTSCASGTPDDAEIETADATALVEDVLLTNGDVHLTVQAAEQAYSEAADATAVAAMVSITGADSVCMFWYIEGRPADGGQIIADAHARQFSPWGASIVTGSPEDDTVTALKSSPVGDAVMDAISCGPYR